MGVVQASVAPAIPVIVVCGLLNALLALGVQFFWSEHRKRHLSGMELAGR